MAPVIVALLSASLFVGDSPSVARAWISSCALWCALLAQRPSSAVNNLGIAFGALVLYKPLWILHLGFRQLLCHRGHPPALRPVDQLLQRLFPTPPPR